MNTSHGLSVNQDLASNQGVSSRKISQNEPKAHGKSCGCCGASKTAKPALGSDAKSSDTFFDKNRISKGIEQKKVLHENDLLQVIDEETGEIKSVKKHQWSETEVLSPEQMLTEKFSLQGAVRHLMPKSRTAKCTRLTTGGDVAVLKSIEHNKSHYAGLQTCGSVWACPVCSAKVSSRRKEETLQAMNMHLEKGKQIYFITLTFPHYQQDSLAVLRKKQSEALKYYKKSYQYKKFVKETGYQGGIRALEVTFGLSNGWHPHTHEIVFCDNKVTLGSIKKRLFTAWYDSCVKAGLPKPSYRNGVDVKGGEKAGEYINKYGSELALGHTKKARNGRFSPYDLLRAYKHEGDKQLGAKFVEFAEGMKGARQLFWSPKLKAKFGINEMTDEEIANLKEDKANEQGRIDIKKWRSVVRYSGRATVLILAQNHGFDVAESYIDGLFARYVSSGDYEKDELKKKRWLEKQKKLKPKSSYEDFKKQADSLNNQLEQQKRAQSEHEERQRQLELHIQESTEKHIEELKKLGVWKQIN